MKRAKGIIFVLLIVMCLFGLHGLFIAVAEEGSSGYDVSDSKNKPERYSPLASASSLNNFEESMEYNDFPEEDDLAHSLDVPSIEEIQRKGYPINENGETYGPKVKCISFEPDLILVEYDGLHGYVRQSEISNDGVQSPEEAVERMKGGKTRRINVYLQDGITCVGDFELTK